MLQFYYMKNRTFSQHPIHPRQYRTESAIRNIRIDDVDQYVYFILLHFFRISFLLCCLVIPTILEVISNIALSSSDNRSITSDLDFPANIAFKILFMTFTLFVYDSSVSFAITDKQLYIFHQHLRYISGQICYFLPIRGNSVCFCNMGFQMLSFMVKGI